MLSACSIYCHPFGQKFQEILEIGMAWEMTKSLDHDIIDVVQHMGSMSFPSHSCFALSSSTWQCISTFLFHVFPYSYHLISFRHGALQTMFLASPYSSRPVSSSALLLSLHFDDCTPVGPSTCTPPLESILWLAIMPAYPTSLLQRTFFCKLPTCTHIRRMPRYFLLLVFPEQYLVYDTAI